MAPGDTIETIHRVRTSRRPVFLLLLCGRGQLTERACARPSREFIGIEEGWGGGEAGRGIALHLKHGVRCVSGCCSALDPIVDGCLHCFVVVVVVCYSFLFN